LIVAYFETSDDGFLFKLTWKFK